MVEPLLSAGVEVVTMVTTKASKHKKLMEAGGVSKLHLAVFQGKQEKVRHTTAERERRLFMF